MYVESGKSARGTVRSPKPTTLLVFGVAVSLLDFAVLYAAADREGVLHVSEGIVYLITTVSFRRYSVTPSLCMLQRNIMTGFVQSRLVTLSSILGPSSRCS
jgi:ABC-type uncharacterized transport system permease subunit